MKYRHIEATHRAGTCSRLSPTDMSASAKLSGIHSDVDILEFGISCCISAVFTGTVIICSVDLVCEH